MLLREALGAVVLSRDDAVDPLAGDEFHPKVRNRPRQLEAEGGGGREDIPVLVARCAGDAVTRLADWDEA